MSAVAPAERRFGYWAAIGACAASIAYGVPQVLQVAGWLPTPLDRYLIFAPSLALAPLFVLAMAASSAQAAPEHRARRLGALALAVVYATQVSSAYAIQLGSVLPREAAGQIGPLSDFTCCTFRAPITTVDLLGYTHMCLSLLLLATTYGRGWLRWMLLANGALAPALFFQLVWPELILVGAIWLVVFPLAMALLARDLDRGDS